MRLEHESSVVWKKAVDFRQISVLQTANYCNYIPLDFKCDYVHN